jgi:SAM-dependent methyltransferase
MTDTYLERARAYWRFAPGGEGKIDTRDLLSSSEPMFLETWARNREARRCSYWEEPHFLRLFSDELAGKRVFSFGCGLAYAETEFLEHDAHVTFADIVPSNVECVRRLCRLRGYDQAAFLVLTDSAETSFGGPYDAIFAYGSLMHMPAERQVKVVQGFDRSLTPGGPILLMLYTPHFVEATGSALDQTAFARASDPSVNGLDNPWSDWHDDEKLLKIAPAFHIARKQEWNEGQFVWYDLRRESGDARPFLDLEAAEEAGRSVYLNISAHAATRADAVLRKVGDGLHVVTGVSQYHYAATFPAISARGLEGATLAVDLTIRSGGASIGLLDPTTDTFLASKGFTWPGRHMHYIGIPRLPGTVQPMRVLV